MLSTMLRYMLALLKSRESSATVSQAQYICELKLFYYEVRIRGKNQPPITIKSTQAVYF